MKIKNIYDILSLRKDVLHYGKDVSMDNTLFETAEKTIKVLREKGLSVGFAESCTGGLIAKTVTDVPGASDVFLGGIVSYANSVKENVLGVRKETLDSVGAVSADTAMQMALGAREQLGADITVSVTGIAGPGGGTEEKPVGLVYMGACYGDLKIICEKCSFSGTRDEIRNQTAQHAFEIINSIIEGEEK